MNDKKVKKRQVYSFEMLHYEDGTTTMRRHNEGFSVIEMMGIAALLQSDLHDLFKENMRADKIERTSTDSPLHRKPEDE